MTLKEKLTQDLKEAMKAKDQVKKNTVTLVRAAIKQYEVDSREELDDEGILAILAKQVKMRNDALADFEKAGRQDLIDTCHKELEVLKTYMPEQLSKEAILDLVKKTAEELELEAVKSNMGKLMGAVMPKVKGRADGNAVKEAVSEFLK